eukprot:gene14125-16246_t
MDYERIEAISKHLGDARINIRLRSATNLLEKLEIGVIDRDALTNSASLTTLLSGVHKAISLILENPADLADHNKESTDLLQALLSIVRATASRTNALNISTKILEQMYFLKETENIVGTVKIAIEETIGTLCGLNKSTGFSRTAHVELDLRTAHLTGAMNASSQQGSSEQSQLHSKFRGAGAILNSRLVHSGWKFPDFVLTERDERWLLDVQYIVNTAFKPCLTLYNNNLQIKVKLQNDCAARDLWDVLEDFPSQAVLLNTHLLHCVLDLVGAPFSQADVDADPRGLHCLSALKWLETLLQKCTHAFSVQLDGSLCTHSPYNQECQDEDAPDLAGKLAKAMYALRHPSLPPSAPQLSNTPCTSSDLHRSRADAAVASLFPGPSVPGLAFACCAASLPLLQSRDTTVGRAVCALLKVALPLVLEPRLSSQATNECDKGMLLEVEHGRLQYLLNRVEQLVAFFGDTFDINAFLTLIDEEDDNTNSTNNNTAAPRSETDRLSSLQGHCFDLTFLSCVLDLFRAVPTHTLLPANQADDGMQRKLCVGPNTLQCLFKIAATSPSLEALLPGCTEVVTDTLSVLDDAALENIQAARHLFTTARIFTIKLDRTLSAGVILEHFTHSAQVCVSLLDASCTVAVPSLQQAIASTLPILLQSAYERLDQDETAAETALNTLCALIERVLTCGAPTAKSVLLTHLLAWLTRSYELLPSPGTIIGGDLFSEQQVQLIQQFNLDASSGRQMASVLATPSVMQALLLCTSVTTTSSDETEISLQAQQVLEVLCAYFLQYHSCDFNSNTNEVHQWRHLLLPLKLAEWEAEHQQSNTLDATFTETPNNNTLSSHEALTSFVRTTMFARSLVVGLFHTDSAVRINSALRVRNDLLHVPLPTGLNEGSNDDAGNMYSVLAYDLFPTGGILKLGSWQTNHATTATISKTMRVPNNSTFTHAGVRKVASIGFSEVEPSMRATALSQVVDMLQSDAHLLHTVDIEWAFTTVKTALSQLITLAQFVSSTT